MKATELRIGNLVDFYDESGKDLLPFKKHKLTIYNILRIVEDDATFEPIPLIEEWLVKGGLLKTELEFVNRYDVDDDFSIDYNRTHKTCCFNISCDYSVCIEFVHEWQNLYFELTRKELIL